MTPDTLVAVDLGASSGRVIAGRIGPRSIETAEVHRFPNEPVELPDGLHWDVLGLFSGVVDGLRQAAAQHGPIRSVGIDGWAVDYGLLDGDGSLLGDPFHYRDSRTAAGVEAAHAVVSHRRLYARTGIQFLPFNTIYQLMAARGTAALGAARSLLLIPDLIGYWLTGVRSSEATNASTTGLCDARTRSWADDLIERLGLPRAVFQDVAEPGTSLGPVRPAVSAGGPIDGSVGRPEVTLVGSHDTASAVVAVPSVSDDAAYVSCGTWSLIGVELDRPLLSEASRAANFTNEAGVDGRVRYLRNVMGLWLLQESLRAWQRTGHPVDLAGVLAAAAAVPPGGPLIDPDDVAFLAPGDMPARIVEACRDTGQEPPTTPGALVRCILDSLAAAYARTIEEVSRLTRREIRVIHIVGGGSQNELLCRLTADACGRPVVAGPVEATGLGNLLVQARALGFVSGDLEDLRAIVRATQELVRYEPASRRRSGRAVALGPGR